MKNLRMKLKVGLTAMVLTAISGCSTGPGTVTGKYIEPETKCHSPSISLGLGFYGVNSGDKDPCDGATDDTDYILTYLKHQDGKEISIRLSVSKKTYDSVKKGDIIDPKTYLFWDNYNRSGNGCECSSRHDELMPGPGRTYESPYPGL